MAKTTQVNSRPCASLDESGGINVPELVVQHNSFVNRASISPIHPHSPLACVPNINTRNTGGKETEGLRAGACGGTFIFIAASIRRPLVGAPALP